MLKLKILSLVKKLNKKKLAKIAAKKGDKEQANDLYEQAEEIYRDLRKHAESEGIFVLAGIFYSKRAHYAPNANAEI